jgi:hypothetical protein
VLDSKQSVAFVAKKVALYDDQFLFTVEKAFVELGITLGTTVRLGELPLYQLEDALAEIYHSIAIKETSPDQGDLNSVDRGPKPKPPPASVCSKHPRWIAATARERRTFIDLGVFKKLPRSADGRFIRPVSQFVSATPTYDSGVQVEGRSGYGILLLVGMCTMRD